MEKIQNPLWNPRRLLQIQFQRLEPDTMKQEKQLYPDEYRRLHDHLQELNVNPHDSVSIITPPFRIHYSTRKGSGQQKKAGNGVEAREKQLLERTMRGLVIAADRFTALLNEEMNRDGVTADNMVRFNTFMSAINHVASCYEKMYRVLESSEPGTFED